MMVLVFSLVEQCDGDSTSEWPLEMVVKLSMHQIDKARYMSTFTIPISISILPQAHLVPLRVGVESITEPLIIVPFVLLIVRHNNLNRSYVDVMVELLYCGSDCVLLLCHISKLVLQCCHLSYCSRAALESVS